MEIALTPEVETALHEQARKEGTSPEMVAIKALREKFVGPEPPQVRPEQEGSLADFLAGHIGVLSSDEVVPGGARMSEKSGADFAQGFDEKTA